MKILLFLGLVLVVGVILGYESAASEYERILASVHKRNARLLGELTRKAVGAE